MNIYDYFMITFEKMKKCNRNIKHSKRLKSKNKFIII